MEFEFPLLWRKMGDGLVGSVSRVQIGTVGRGRRGRKEVIMEAVVCPLGKYMSVEFEILRQLTK